MNTHTPSEVRRGVFYRDDPRAASVPIVVDVSRSGREYPTDFRSPVPLTAVHDNISMFVDELFSATPDIGGTLLYACFPNMYIDTNRSARDIDPSSSKASGLGPSRRETSPSEDSVCSNDCPAMANLSRNAS